MKGKKLSEMTDAELHAHIAHINRMRGRAQILIACGFALKAVVLIVLLYTYGCATIENDPAPTVTRVIAGGMRMPDDEACAIATDKDGNTELVSCSRK